jgi:putative zinc finger/helix-turn-helix YgiT family protein
MSIPTKPCSACGAPGARTRITTVEIQPLGRVTRFPRIGWHCDHCGEITYDDAQLATNARAEREAKATALQKIGGDDLRTLRAIVGLRQQELEMILGLGRNTVAPWETGRRPLPPYLVAVVRLLALRPTLLRELAWFVGLEISPKTPSRAGRPRAKVMRRPKRAAALTRPAASTTSARSTLRGS